MSSFRLRSLFVRERSDLTPGQIIRWWELRRIIFNIVVGLAGLTSCVVMFTTGTLMEAHGYDAVGIPDPPIAAIVVAFVYGVMANICYTGGWMSELVARRIWSVKSSSYAKIIFAVGLVGSVLLTLLPALLTVIVALGVVIAESPKAH